MNAITVFTLYGLVASALGLGFRVDYFPDGNE